MLLNAVTERAFSRVSVGNLTSDKKRQVQNDTGLYLADISESVRSILGNLDCLRVSSQVCALHMVCVVFEVWWSLVFITDYE